MKSIRPSCVPGLATILLAFFATSIHCALLAAGLSVEERKGSLVIQDGQNEVLVYHTAEVDPPAGADRAYKRSGFIHPLRTPKGKILTGIHPADHYHHLGLWHAWVNAKFGDDKPDFWNLKKKTGRVRYAKTLELIRGKKHAGFVVEQEHVAYVGDKAVVVLRETFRVVARKIDGAYEIDYFTQQKNVSDTALEFPAYRYGGTIAYRAPALWDKSNSDYLSSEGKTRVDGHQTRSRWCAFHGPAQKESESIIGLAILCHPANHDFPQRMRVWPPNINNGAVFFNYVPIQEKPWRIAPGEVSSMRYRLIAQDSRPESKALNGRWKRFSKQK